MNFLFWKARRDEWTNDSSSAEQVSQRVPYNGSQKKNTTKNMSLIPYGLSSPVFSAIYYVFCLMKNVQFEQTWRALQSKQRDLKRKGKGNKPNASAALSEEDIQALFEKDLLEVWFNNIIHFRLLGCQNFHRAEVPRIQWKGNQNSFKKRSTECKSHCIENGCCAEQPEMSSTGLQSLRRKATRGNGNQRCTVYFDNKQCKIWQQRRAANW